MPSLFEALSKATVVEGVAPPPAPDATQAPTEGQGGVFTRLARGYDPAALTQRVEAGVGAIFNGGQSTAAPAAQEDITAVATNLGIEPSHLDNVINFETGGTYSPSVKNGAGSGATGLIQFMPSTARAMGTSVEALSQMAPKDQLGYVQTYFEPYKGQLKNQGDVYMAVLWPQAIGKADDYVLFDQNKATTAYAQNIGLDFDKDGKVTRGEAVRQMLGNRK